MEYSVSYDPGGCETMLVVKLQLFGSESVHAYLANSNDLHFLTANDI